MQRAYEQEQARLVIGSDLSRDEADVLLERWCDRSQRSRLAPSVKAAKTDRQQRNLILNAIELGISNGHLESLNTKVRLIIRRAYGLPSADTALALVMLAAGPIKLQLTTNHEGETTA